MSSDLRTLVDQYIESYRQLSTPVAVFAEAHESQNEARIATVREQLIPLSTPGPGEQYAFEVNLDSCTGCKACVSACHSLNGLDDEEAWRDVGLIFGGSSEAPYQQTVTSACHHCADPGCLNGCPVLAYEKDPISGIVRHLDDQCIGCQYCVLKCPYDVPKYNSRLGIVRKCDMCHQRLAVGEAPACAQACPTHAIRIVKVPLVHSEMGGPSVPVDKFLPAAPDASLTGPSTRYVSKHSIPENARAADLATLRPQQLHGPLVLMLTLTQAGYGLLLGNWLHDAPFPTSVPAMTGLGLILAGLIASAAHLGQPLRMWRVFLNLRRSWLSREAVILGLSFGLLNLAATSAYVNALSAFSPVLLAAGLLTGLLGVVCSAMIYIDTGRYFWNAPSTLLKMGGTLALFATTLLMPPAAGLLLLCKLLLEMTVLLELRNSLSRKSQSARLIIGPLRGLALLRLGIGLLASGLLIAECLPQTFTLPLLALLLCGELAERALFFRAVDSSKMPGMPATATPDASATTH